MSENNSKKKSNVKNKLQEQGEDKSGDFVGLLKDIIKALALDNIEFRFTRFFYSYYYYYCYYHHYHYRLLTQVFKSVPFLEVHTETQKKKKFF
jgi:hypothetical protein